MKLDISSPEPKLRALRVQLIELDDAVLIKRGRAELRVGGPRAVDVVQLVLLGAADGATRSELCEPFSAPDRPAVERLIGELEARSFLVPLDGPAHVPAGEETTHDVFAWHFADSAASLAARLSSRRITVLGVNVISRQLATSLTSVGVQNVDVVDYPLLANLRMFDEQGRLNPLDWAPVPLAPIPYQDWWAAIDPEQPTTVVATTDFGGLQTLRWWNEQANRRGWHYLPVALKDLVGYVGPLVVPGETACYECLRARQNSHLSDPALSRASESLAFEGQAVTGYHPSMASILGDLAALELIKAYSGWEVPRLTGSLVEVNLLATSMTSRKVLRVPRCGICGGGRRRPAVSLDKNVLMPGHEG